MKSHCEPDCEPDWERIKRIVADALEAAPDQQGALIVAACRGDARMLAAARALLASYHGATGFLEAGAVLPPPVVPPPP